MTLLHDATVQKKFDSRLIERAVSRGHLKQEELDKNVKELPDDSASADYVSLDTLLEEIREGKID